MEVITRFYRFVKVDLSRKEKQSRYLTQTAAKKECILFSCGCAIAVRYATIYLVMMALPCCSAQSGAPHSSSGKIDLVRSM